MKVEIFLVTDSDNTQALDGTLSIQERDGFVILSITNPPRRISVDKKELEKALKAFE